ncbi:IS5 family transposase [Candidatus Pacearchaeota archaeon]|nr:IS5 family transposase [Candidatus Pacearchaeota archaeon]
MKEVRNLQIKIKRLLKKIKYPEFLHRFGPKTYKLEDHVSRLLVMQICQLSLRRIEKISNIFGQKCPTYSALCKSRKKIPIKLWQKLLKLTAGLSSGKVAIDGTGFSKSNPSFHYLKRIDSKNPKNYTKLSALLDLETKKFLVMRIRTTPRHDMQDVKYLLKRVRGIKSFSADKGYDSEEVHEICYWKGIQTYIPSRKNVKHGWARKKQIKNWDQKEYNLRGNVESGFSAIKRKYGGFVRAKRIEGMRAEIILKGIAHNLELIN